MGNINDKDEFNKQFLELNKIITRILLTLKNTIESEYDFGKINDNILKRILEDANNTLNNIKNIAEASDENTKGYLEIEKFIGVSIRNKILLPKS